MTEFNFPFKPYDIQVEFMQHLFETIDKKCIGIFESPTGTGKSLSLLCGSLKWLSDYNCKMLEYNILNEKVQSFDLDCSNQKSNISSQPSWVSEFIQEKKNSDTQSQINRLLLLREKRKQKTKESIKDISLSYYKNNYSILNKRINNVDSISLNDTSIIDDEFVDQDASEHIGDDDGDAILKNILENSSESDEEKELEIKFGVKIFYCSRTHAEISQFVEEFKKTTYNYMSMVSLGSRENLCINHNVKKYGNSSIINDLCLDLLQNQKHCKCPFYSTQRIKQFRDMILNEPLDIESLVVKGQELGACPYYSTRKAIKFSNLVVMPYQMILHSNTRNSMDLNLTNQVLLLDEAHNLSEIIQNVYSQLITEDQLVSTIDTLIKYKDKYKIRFKAENLLLIKQLIHILESFLFMLVQNQDSNEYKTEIAMNQSEFLFKAGVDHINLFSIVKFCTKTRLARKLSGFSNNLFCKIKSSNIVNNNNNNNVYFKCSIQPILSFIELLCSIEEDGRIIVTKKKSLKENSAMGSLHFLLLNPGRHFYPVVLKTRSAIITGGTLEPIIEFDHILNHINSNSINNSNNNNNNNNNDNNNNNNNNTQIRHFSFGHIVQSDQLLPIVLVSGPTSKEFEFRYDARHDSYLIEELGRALVNFASIIPKGIVVFFPSYDYLNVCFEFWTKSKILDRLAAKKVVYQDSRKVNVFDLFNSYSIAITSSKSGAILFSIVNGKLSEGINFSDDLARAVVVVGMPYPNIESAEIKEKMAYYDRQKLISIKDINSSNCFLSGNEYYENLCIKAVNQSIGRALRHSKDYATIILFDKRYSYSRVMLKLPKWISEHIVVHHKFGSALRNISDFFKLK